jgi:hypothetical protein
MRSSVKKPEIGMTLHIDSGRNCIPLLVIGEVPEIPAVAPAGWQLMEVGKPYFKDGRKFIGSGNFTGRSVVLRTTKNVHLKQEDSE